LNITANQNELAKKKHHKKIISFYEENNLTVSDFFNLDKFRINRNNESYPLDENDILSSVEIDIEGLNNDKISQKFKVIKKILEKLLIGIKNYQEK